MSAKNSARRDKKNIDFCLFTPPDNTKRLVWEISHNCNLKCRHCCVDATPDGNNCEAISDLEQMKKSADEIVDFGVNEFYLSGGEPFLQKSCLPLIAHLKSRNAKVSLATNATVLSEITVKSLSRLKIDLIHVSVDGYCEKIHDDLRGLRCFKTVEKNISLLTKYHIPVRVGSMIWRGSESSLEKMVEFCLDHQVGELRFSWLINTGRFLEHPEISPQRDVNEVMKEIVDLQKKYALSLKISVHRNPFIKFVFTKQAVCTAGESLFFLDASGSLAPCSWLAKTDKSFLTKARFPQTPIARLAGSPEFSLFKKMEAGRVKAGCSGCPFMARLSNGSYLSDDPIYSQ